jgi:hypothetical protein
MEKGGKNVRVNKSMAHENELNEMPVTIRNYSSEMPITIRREQGRRLFIVSVMFALHLFFNTIGRSSV